MRERAYKCVMEKKEGGEVEFIPDSLLFAMRFVATNLMVLCEAPEDLIVAAKQALEGGEGGRRGRRGRRRGRKGKRVIEWVKSLTLMRQYNNHWMKYLSPTITEQHDQSNEYNTMDTLMDT